MKLLALLAALAVGGFFLTRHPAATPKPQTTVLVTPGPNPVGPPPTPNPLRKPIAKTQQVLGEVKQRNGDGEF